MPDKIPGFIMNIKLFKCCHCVQQMKEDLVPKLPLGIKIEFEDMDAIHVIFKGENATKERLESFIDGIHDIAVSDDD